MCLRATYIAKTHVWCDGYPAHKIIVTDHGKLAFPNHPGLEEWQLTLIYLSGEQPHGCWQVFEAWRTQDWSKVSARVRKKLAKAREQRRQ
jgi:hypothetical protein